MKFRYASGNLDRLLDACAQLSGELGKGPEERAGVFWFCGAYALQENLCDGCFEQLSNIVGDLKKLAKERGADILKV